MPRNCYPFSTKPPQDITRPTSPPATGPVPSLETDRIDELACFVNNLSVVVCLPVGCICFEYYSESRQQYLLMNSSFLKKSIFELKYYSFLCFKIGLLDIKEWISLITSQNFLDRRFSRMGGFAIPGFHCI